MRATLMDYIQLMRLDKPVGIFLLLWPTLWALWLAGEGMPSIKNVIIFVLGVILMRSAGCIMNDFADRHVDKHVERTRFRPLTSGKITPIKALILFAILCLTALSLVIWLNALTILLACFGFLFCVIYPFLKRITHLPQLGLGVAFAWGVPMAFAAELNTVPTIGWLVFLAAAVWPVMYDTIYAMVDRNDDIKIGIKSTAILWGKHDRLMIAVLQILFLILMMLVGIQFNLSYFYYANLSIAGLLFVYQQWLIHDCDPKNCFRAFLNNQWVGFVIFIGILI